MREKRNAIFSSNRLKLGLFCHNATVPQMSRAPERYYPTWDRSLEVVRRADSMGFEAVVSLASYRGPVQKSPEHCSHMDLEPFTWASAIGALTKHSTIVATVHVPLSSPAFVAKATTTIDHVTGGRAALNLVAGASQIIFDMFGKTVESPEIRYDRLEEFFDILHSFWTKHEEFDHSGRFYKVLGGVSVPKPLQDPFPPIINAGVSERGSDFAAKSADIAFTHIRGTQKDWKVTIGSYKNRARDIYNRDIQVWTHGYVVIRDTQDEAERYLKYYSQDFADDRWVKAWIRELGENLSELRPAQRIHIEGAWAAGGGFPLVGTPDSVLEKLILLSESGLDGILLTALEPEKMLDGWEREIMPRLEKEGMRFPFGDLP